MGDSLRIALLVYRGNPHSGGQGVYTHHLSKELAALGHHVEVFSGQPYPNLAPEVPLVKVPSLDLYRADDPFHIPHLDEFRSAIDVLEFAIMCTAGFPEPRTFSRRVRTVLNARRNDFDVIHDNQCLGNGILWLLRDGWPIVEPLHHPITVDRRLELAQNPWTKRPLRQVTLRRWFGFLRMQCRVARQMPRIVTVSESSRRDITRDMGVPYERMSIVPVGVDTDHFRPLPQLKRAPGRIMTTASADVAPGDAGALAGAIGRVLDDPALGERLGTAGRAHVLDRFTWSEMARQTVEQYRLAIDEQSRGNSCRNSTAISSKQEVGG